MRIDSAAALGDAAGFAAQALRGIPQFGNSDDKVGQVVAGSASIYVEGLPHCDIESAPEHQFEAEAGARETMTVLSPIRSRERSRRTHSRLDIVAAALGEPAPVGLL